MNNRDWSQARNLLCIRLDSIGDVLMATPAMRALKQSAPQRRLTLLTSSTGASVAPMIPELDDVIVYDAPWMKATPARRDATQDAAMVETLAARGFDAAVIFTTFSQSPLPAALLCYLAGIPLRLAHCHESPYQLLTDTVQDPEPSRCIRHEVRRQLDLVAQAGCLTEDESLSLRVPMEARESVSRQLEQERGLNPERPWVLIHPGSSAASRRYPAPSFAEVARALVLEHGYQVVFSGSESERALVEHIVMLLDAPVISLIGRTGLAELSALITLAPLLISNNTGPVHIAAAVQTPVVDLYAMTNPQHQPWQVPHRVLMHETECGYCYKSVCTAGHHACLAGIAPSEVVAATLSLVEEVGLGEARLVRI
ncbi:MAG TPA: lipopolysaccharide heptosyltransferase II [Dehalococcoidia bacterium]|nr:lipopolysaccharide heptosyltransferase II [Dehalococcoidia bacterium]